MDAMARWAASHYRIASVLIVFLELANSLFGLTLGAGLWTTEVLPITASAMPLHSLTILLIGAVVYIRLVHITHEDEPPVARKRIKRWCMVGLFYLNFLLYGLLGGLWAQRTTVFHPSGGVGSYHRVEGARDTIAPGGYQRVERTPVPVSARKNPSLTLTRIGYGLLFLLSLGIAYVAAALSCSLICSGQGFLAAFVILLGTGALGAGIYFLGRAFTPDLKLYREMTTDERKREGRRLRRSWLVGIVSLLVSFLLGAAVN